MGILDGIFGLKVANPTLVAAIEAYHSSPDDEKLLDVWQKFLKAKVLVATTQDGAKNLAKIKNIREGLSQPCHTSTGEKGETLLACFTDPAAFEAFTSPKTPAAALAGDQVLALANGKGVSGLIINPRGSATIELKAWQHLVLVERCPDARKLHGLATKFIRSSNLVDAEGVLKGCITAAQKDPGPHHPFTAELNCELARVLQRQNKLNEAEWVLKRGLQIYESSGSNDLELASTAEHLGYLYQQNRKVELASSSLLRALDIFESVPGAKPESVGRILTTMSEIRMAEGKAEDAEQFLKRAAMHLEERKHPDLPGIINRLAAFCEEQGKPKEAVANYRRSIQVWKERSKKLDLTTAEHRLALLLIDEKKYDEAEQLLKKVVEDYKEQSIIEFYDELQEKLAEIEQKRQEMAAPPPKKEKKAELPLFSPGVPLAPRKQKSQAETEQQQELDALGHEEEPAPVVEQRPLDPEQEALEKMRRFLNSFDKDEMAYPNEEPGAEAATTAASQTAAAPRAKPSEPTISIDAASLLPPFAVPSQNQPDFDTNGTDKDDAADKVDAAFDSLLGPNAPSSDRYDKPIGERNAPATHSSAPAIDPVAASKEAINSEKVDSAFGQLLGDMPASDYDIPIAERLKRKAEAEAAATASPSTPNTSAAPAVADDPVTPSKEDINSDKVDSAFGQLLGDMPASDYDIPIAERLKRKAAAENAATASPPSQTTSATPAVADDAVAPSKEEINAEKVDSAFDQLLGPSKAPSRYDMPIAERLKMESEKRAEAEALTAPTVANTILAPLPPHSSQSSRDDDAVSLLFRPETDESERIDEPISERPKPPSDPVTAASSEASKAKSSISEDDPLALQKCDAILEVEPQNSGIWMVKGNLLLKEQKLDDAMRCFDKLTTISPNNLDGWYLKGACLHKKNRNEDALYCFNYALKINPNHPPSMLEKADCLVKLGRTEQGMALYDKLLISEPKMIQGWLNKAKVYATQRRFQDAIHCLDQVLEIDPNHPEAIKARELAATKLGAQ